jgi:hypothetical protein
MQCYVTKHLASRKKSLRDKVRFNSQKPLGLSVACSVRALGSK